MEGNDKEFRQSFSLPIFIYRQKEGKSILSVNIPKIMFIFSILMLLMVYANLFLACSTNFTCSVFLPTLTYIGCFRGHDRIFIVSCTFYSLILTFLYSGAYYHFASSLSDIQKMFLRYSGLISCVILPFIGLTDEVNGVHMIPLEPIYSFLSASFLILNVLWSGLVFFLIYNSRSSLNLQENRWFCILSFMLSSFAIMFMVTLIEWNWAYSTYSNSLLNENVEAMCEWALVTIAILLPPVFCQFFRGFFLTFAVNTGSTKLDPKSDELEMADFTGTEI